MPYRLATHPVYHKKLVTVPGRQTAEESQIGYREVDAAFFVRRSAVRLKFELVGTWSDQIRFESGSKGFIRLPGVKRYLQFTHQALHLVAPPYTPVAVNGR